MGSSRMRGWAGRFVAATWRRTRHLGKRASSCAWALPRLGGERDAREQQHAEGVDHRRRRRGLRPAERRAKEGAASVVGARRARNARVNWTARAYTFWDQLGATRSVGEGARPCSLNGARPCSLNG
eukprot:1601835-Pleurochrysis_carterae.AAC.3